MHALQAVSAHFLYGQNCGHIPDVHESKTPYVWGVFVCDKADDLLLGQLQSEQLVQQAEGTRHNPSCSYTSYLQSNMTKGKQLVHKARDTIPLAQHLTHEQ